MELSSIVTSSTTISPASSHHPRDHSASSALNRSSLHHTDALVESHPATSASRMSEMEFAPTHPAHQAHAGRPAPMSQLGPKTVRFQLISAESPQYQARLPMRVQIYPHDTTDSIVTTVKNFYGLYSSPTVSKGVSFEDEENNTMIARYENFRQGMTVYVRVIEAPAAPGAFPAPMFNPPPVGAQAYLNGSGGGGGSGGGNSSDGGWASLQPPQHLGQHISRPGSRTSRKRSPSPNSGRGRRSTSVSTNPKVRSRSTKNRGPGGSQAGQAADACSDSLNGYSSGDNAPGSASGKGKEHIGNTEISVENIVEGGRRKRAKFESSELPLFAPPQMPAATSNPSVSPARRADHARASLPFVHPGQSPFTHPRPLQSPQAYTNGFAIHGIYATPMSESRHTRASISYPPSNGIGPGAGILPTPDPTVGSCMSEEDKDVAMQLMRLGDISNISHGRTSASTQDDTFSGKADAASSTGATSDTDSDSEEDDDVDDDLPPARKQRLDMDGNSKHVYHPATTESHFLPTARDGGANASGDDADSEDGAEEGLMRAPKLKSAKTGSALPGGAGSKPRAQPSSSAPKAKSSSSTTTTTAKPAKAKPAGSANGTKIKKAATVSNNGPMSPASLPASRKPSVVSNLGFPGMVAGEDDQPDLSTKPRCQRCRKSKKGCDRQRPCGRCKDAGIPADQCISEDEGNGRKGRYGRHMGVPIKKEEVPIAPPALLPAAPITPAIAATVSLLAAAADKNKKRKR